MKQLSVFIENQVGKLSEVFDFLKSADVNIRAVTIAETRDFGIVRMIVDQIEFAEGILKKEGLSCTQTEVIAVEIQDKTGGLSDLLHFFRKASINIDYMYGFLEPVNKKAIMVFRVKDPIHAKTILNDNGIILFDGIV